MHLAILINSSVHIQAALTVHDYQMEPSRWSCRRQEVMNGSQDGKVRRKRRSEMSGWDASNPANGGVFSQTFLPLLLLLWTSTELFVYSALITHLLVQCSLVASLRLDFWAGALTKLSLNQFQVKWPFFDVTKGRTKPVDSSLRSFCKVLKSLAKHPF